MRRLLGTSRRWSSRSPHHPASSCCRRARRASARLRGIGDPVLREVASPPVRGRSGLLVVAVAVISVVPPVHLATISQGIALGIVALSLVLLTATAARSRSASNLLVWALHMGKVAGGAAPGWGSSPVGICAPRHARRTARAPAARPSPGAGHLAFGRPCTTASSPTPRSSPATGLDHRRRAGAARTQGIGDRTNDRDRRVFGACAIGSSPAAQCVRRRLVA